MKCWILLAIIFKWILKITTLLKVKKINLLKNSVDSFTLLEEDFMTADCETYLNSKFSLWYTIINSFLIYLFNFKLILTISHFQ